MAPVASVIGASFFWECYRFIWLIPLGRSDRTIPLE